MNDHIDTSLASTSCRTCRLQDFSSPIRGKARVFPLCNSKAATRTSSMRPAASCAKLTRGRTRAPVTERIGASACAQPFPVFFQCGHRSAQGRLLLKPSAQYLYAVMLVFCGFVCASGAKRSTTFRGGKRRYAEPPLCAATWRTGLW